MTALPTRDAMLPALTFMVAAAQQGKPLSALLKGWRSVIRQMID